ncbi:MAG: transposase [Gammaproteobacteria bacterium]|nr:transposase [Gammaproteobacteria bacterium]MYG67464.1 transposase [Gammaproteobacteria bacterium]
MPHDLTDAQWAFIEPLLPPLPRRADGRGRPWRKTWRSAVRSTLGSVSLTAASARPKRGRRSRQDQAGQGLQGHGDCRSLGVAGVGVCGQRLAARNHVCARTDRGMSDGGPARAAHWRQGLRQRPAGRAMRKAGGGHDCAAPGQPYETEDTGRAGAAPIPAPVEG